MAEDRFHLVRQITAQEKYFDFSIIEVLWGLNRGSRFETTWTHAVDGPDGEITEVDLKLHVGGAIAYPLSWDVALLLHNVRIDGIGYHEWFLDLEGNECSGWHRHVWDERLRSAKGKRTVDGFADDLSFEEFLIRSLKELKIAYNKVERDTGQLF